MITFTRLPKADHEGIGKYHFHSHATGHWGYADSKSDARARIREALHAEAKFRGHTGGSVTVRTYRRNGKTVRGYTRRK